MLPEYFLKIARVFSSTLRRLKSRVPPFLQKTKDAEQVFTEIYRKNTWGGKDSLSGTGSDCIQTKTISRELPKLFKELAISTILDIPCGDFYWMKGVDLTGLDYIGADIVDNIIQNNIAMYAKDNVHFKKVNILSDDLPDADLIFCRDCLVHFSFNDALTALKNISGSGSKYLLTTTFTERQRNHDITTGDWRTINLELAPFSFSIPIKLIRENCSEADGIYQDKSLGVWRVSDIRKALQKDFA